jgi:AhpD family alkylhydroperoxidase
MPAVLDKQTEELIAVGVAYAINCIKCMNIHNKVALSAGVSLEEINDALKVAEGVVTGARNVSKTEAEAIFGTKVEEGNCCPEGSDCCP